MVVCVCMHVDGLGGGSPCLVVGCYLFIYFFFESSRP